MIRIRLLKHSRYSSTWLTTHIIVHEPVSYLSPWNWEVCSYASKSLKPYELPLKNPFNRHGCLCEQSSSWELSLSKFLSHKHSQFQKIFSYILRMLQDQADQSDLWPQGLLNRRPRPSQCQAPLALSPRQHNTYLNALHHASIIIIIIIVDKQDSYV